MLVVVILLPSCRSSVFKQLSFHFHTAISPIAPVLISSLRTRALLAATIVGLRSRNSMNTPVSFFGE
jgi:hypothetical protein